MYGACMALDLGHALFAGQTITILSPTNPFKLTFCRTHTRVRAGRESQLPSSSQVYVNPTSLDRYELGFVDQVGLSQRFLPWLVFAFIHQYTLFFRCFISIGIYPCAFSFIRGFVLQSQL